MTTLHSVSLFSGIGLLDLAMHRAMQEIAQQIVDGEG